MPSANENHVLALLKIPFLRVVSTYLWFFAIPAMFVIFVLLVLRMDFSTARMAFTQHKYLIMLIELLTVGFLPMVISLICRDSPDRYGFLKKGVGLSLLLSSAFVVLVFVYQYLTTGNPLNSAVPDQLYAFPWNIALGVAGILIYGPLEAFFVLWLIVNTDQIFRVEDWLLSPGLVITAALFGGLHIVTTQSVVTAIWVAVIFFCLGLIFKYTKNSVGPILAWTLINGQVWYYLLLIFQVIA